MELKDKDVQKENPSVIIHKVLTLTLTLLKLKNQTKKSGGIPFRVLRAKRSKCFFTYIHLDLYRFHSSI